MKEQRDILLAQVADNSNENTEEKIKRYNESLSLFSGDYTPKQKNDALREIIDRIIWTRTGDNLSVEFEFK